MLNRSDLDTIKSNLLLDSVPSCTSLGFVVSEVNEYHKIRSVESTIESAMIIVTELLTDELFEIGDFVEHGFSAWSMTTQEAIRKIEDKLISSNANVPLDNTFWLVITEKGKRAAEKLQAL
jgi:hypothetical protein